ncbi:type I methionyl aminopeptidase [Holospora curviuscula]|uniref:Methionine aminopeptidase n=1 Tax=Holospora curviuscula TaxID=1082868 RepID=A0A2S5RAS5_9PROT|nr:type I methionyl aminopeptidase [Holospora curviuscula]PPE04225.1 Methionine aminopeptidase [Holospora curviuscula]
MKHNKKISIYTDPEAWEGMRKAGRLASQVLNMIEPYVVAGVTTVFLNDLCHKYIIDHDAFPAPLEVGFPCAVCISVNETICHGIPSTRVLNAGDIVNIDVSLRLEGWYADTCRMFYVERPSASARQLTEVCHQALMSAIALVKPGVTLGDIGHIIQKKTESSGFSVVREFCGHGIGRKLHDAPEVLHFGTQGTGISLKEGMFFTIEPMINLGKPEVRFLKDGWSAVTKDGQWSAQWEQTIGVTSTGCEIFTPFSPL